MESKGLNRRLLYLLACAVCLGAGLYFGRPAKVTGLQAVRGKNATQSGHTWNPEDVLPMEGSQARKLVLQRSIAACDTEALWEWLATLPQGQDLAKDLVMKELIDRLDWGAWQHVLGLESGRARDLVGEGILMRLAERDPWKAHEEWQRHRGNFEHEIWGFGVIAECTEAAAAMSADQVLKVFGSIPRNDADQMMHVEYAPDFDFRKVLDQLASDGPQPFTLTEGLLPSWGDREPEQAAAWLSSHPEYLKREYQRTEAGELLSRLVGMEMDDGMRERLLHHFSGLPRDFLDQTWQGISAGTGGELSPETLHSADLMGQREVYLEKVLLDTRPLEKLDDHWETLPLQERRELLDKVEQKWAGEENTAVAAKARGSWREMVEREWGIR